MYFEAISNGTLHAPKFLKFQSQYKKEKIVVV